MQDTAVEKVMGLLLQTKVEEDVRPQLEWGNLEDLDLYSSTVEIVLDLKWKGGSM